VPVCLMVRSPPPSPPPSPPLRASLRECEADEEMARLVPDILGADPMAAALLIECRGRDASALQVSHTEQHAAGWGWGWGRPPPALPPPPHPRRLPGTAWLLQLPAP
jgi:hypothetical protein